MKKLLYMAWAALCAASCIYPYNPDISKDVTRTVVVDGTILINGTSTIQVGYLYPLNGYSSDVARGYAWVEDDLGNKYYPIERGEQTLLHIPTDSPLIQRATSFRAVVEVDGNTYTSDWTTPDPAPQIKGIHFVPDDTAVHVTADLETGVENPGHIGFMYEETWEFHSDFYSEYDVNPDSWEIKPRGLEDYPYYWCYRYYNPLRLVLADLTTLQAGTVNNVPVTTFSRYDSRNHRKYSILLKAFSLSEDAYQYNRQLQEMSDLGGDLFSPNPGALESNLVCETDPEREVMGMVLSGRVATRRVFYDGRYGIVSRPSTYQLVAPPADELPHYYYDLQYVPVTYIEIDGSQVMGWGPLRCINCIVAGGTQEKPSFWED